MISSLRLLFFVLVVCACSADGTAPLARADVVVEPRRVDAVPPPPPPAEPEHADACPTGFRCDPSAFGRQPITSLLVQKRAHALHLVAGTTIVRSYRVALGAGGLGQKAYEGDKVTPIGSYRITGRYSSRWHTYLALDYPSQADRERHAQLVAAGDVPDGRGPGSAIALHGRRADMPDGLHKLIDWTLGCVALDNDEIDEVASLVSVGTAVVIEP
jgi:L,D-transpeptidase-like protein